MTSPGGLKSWLRGPRQPNEKGKKSSSKLDRRRIAVLPFSNMSPDPSDEYFADGMTEELIATISKISDVSVVSRTSMMRYRKNPKPVPEVAEELQAGTILEGSVRKAGNKVRVTIQLVNAAQDKPEWAESYDRGLEDIFAIQSDISQNVAEHLKVQLIASERQRLQIIPTHDVGAYALYLKGRAHMSERTQSGFLKAIAFFEGATKRDARYAAAYAGLADCYNLMENWSYTTPQAAWPKAMAFTVKALELDNSLAEAHASRAYCLAFMKWDWRGSEREYRLALELNPSYAQGHHWYAWTVLQLQKRWDEAIQEITKAEELDPFSPIISVNKARILLWAGRREEGLEQFRLAVKMNREIAFAHAEFGVALVYTSSIEEGIAETETAMRLSPNEIWPKSNLACAYMAANRKADVERILQELKDISKKRYVAATLMATVYAVLGEKDSAFEWLNRGAQEGTSSIVVLNDVVFEGLRTDPRFPKLLEGIGLSNTVLN